MTTRTARIRIGARRKPRSPRDRVGFTLIEMLVVISVIVVVLAIVVPSVGRIMRSTNYAAAVNAVTATLGRARAAAMESGRPTAVAFLFDIKERRYTMLVLELAPNSGAARIEIGRPQTGDPDCAEDLTTPPPPPGPPNPILAYQPLRFSQPTELPVGMGVFGLSTLIPEIDTDGNTTPELDRDRNGEVDPIARSRVGRAWDLQLWYAGEILNDGNNNADDNVVPWIFPRNDPRLYVDEGVDPWRVISGEQTTAALNVDEARSVVRHAQSFAIAFRPDGSVSANFGDGITQPIDAYIEWPNEPLDESGTGLVPGSSVRASLPYDHIDAFDPGCIHPTNPSLTRPNPEVRLRTAALLAVVDLQSLQAGAGVSEPWLVRPASTLAPQPSAADRKSRLINDDFVLSMSRWIDENAQVIGFNRYTGATVKR